MAGIIQKAADQQKAVAERKKPKMQNLIEQMKPAIEAALPSVLTPERFTRICLSALSGSKALQECEPRSFLAAMMTAAQLGVEVNSGLQQAYLIPYKNHGQLECQFQLG